MTTLVAPVLDAPGLRRQSPPTLYQGTTPAAGANFARDLNEGLWLRLVCVFVRLVTSADAANREVTLEYRDQEGNVYARAGAPVAQTADTTTDYFFSAFRSSSEWPVNGSVLTTLDPIILPQDHEFGIVVAAIDNTDALSRIRYVAEKFYPPSSDDFAPFA